MDLSWTKACMHSYEQVKQIQIRCFTSRQIWGQSRDRLKQELLAASFSQMLEASRSDIGSCYTSTPGFSPSLSKVSTLRHQSYCQREIPAGPLRHSNVEYPSLDTAASASAWSRSGRFQFKPRSCWMQHTSEYFRKKASLRGCCGNLE